MEHKRGRCALVHDPVCREHTCRPLQATVKVGRPLAKFQAGTRSGSQAATEIPTATTCATQPERCATVLTRRTSVRSPKDSSSAETVAGKGPTAPRSDGSVSVPSDRRRLIDALVTSSHQRRTS